MRSFLIICVLASMCIGCDGPNATHERRERRRRGRDKKEDIVKPVDPPVRSGFAVMQATQIDSRVTMCKEIAAGIRDGSIKTMFDINKFINERQSSIGKNVNAELTKRLAADIQAADGDSLKPDAADKFDKYATEFDSVLKK